MANSTKAAIPKKPHPDYPLSPRRDGRFAKKVRGVVHIFGGTAEEALTEWLRVKDDLLAGRTPRASGDGFTVRDLCNKFLTAKERQRDAGELSPHTFRDYQCATDLLIAQFGKTRLVADLAADDFEQLRETIATNSSPVTVGNRIQYIRVVFKYAADCGLIDKPMRYGPMFKRPSRKVLRLARAKQAPRCSRLRTSSGCLPWRRRS